MACSVAAAGASQAFYPSLMAQDHYSSEATLSSSSSSPSPLNFRPNRCSSTLRRSSSKGTRSPVVDNSSGASTSGATSETGLLKRKRPARIVIPAMRPLKLAAESDSGVEVVEVESQRFSVFCKRGKTRKEMEDRFKASLDVQRNPHSAFFGVYDGHGGTAAAEFAAENMVEYVMGEVAKREEEDSDGYEYAVRSGYLRTDREFLEKQGAGGTCCVTAVINNGDLVVSNAGDCRAVISRGGDAEALTSDHRPSREDERARIESLGGFLDHCGGLLRLQGSLAVSRGIGDRHLKQWVTAEPETTVTKIGPDSEFLILASDGLWENVSNQEAVDLARPSCVDSSGRLSLLSACRSLADLSISRGSNDDVSVMIIRLRDFL
ncbi:unnamed protein product [Spirodela intermedia]|uniref:protein-serine/threonine phosphatase n=1 Tax=Spirodela intermedia TaxID=51605 RepID=A0A7I8L894_SPIIN|nr:unnamed protein product [Spirodela intermedia]